ncbi:MAG: hypothetical protein R3C45_22095 [Phycisphaerales bacterium]
MEAAVTIEAYLEAFHVTGEHVWVDRADRCLNWFLGENDLHTPVYDHRSGGCHDAADAAWRQREPGRRGDARG